MTNSIGTGHPGYYLFGDDDATDGDDDDGAADGAGYVLGQCL